MKFESHHTCWITAAAICFLSSTWASAQGDFTPVETVSAPGLQESPDMQKPMTEVTPKPNVSHPTVTKTIPPEPPSHISLPSLQVEPVSSASWRVTAMNLAAGKKQDRPYSSCTLDTTYGEALLAAISSCCKAGLKVVELNSDAGEILAIKPDTNLKLVLTIAETSPGKTRFAVGCHAGGAEAARRMIENVIQLYNEQLNLHERI